MVVLTAFRLKNITRAIESLTSSIRPWIFGIFVAWFLSLTLSIVPLIKQTSQYFFHSFSYSSNFQNGTLYKDKLEKFACRFAALTNTTITPIGSKFQSIENFFIGDLPNNASINLFGYYGETSICMPRFYVGHGESSWEYTITIITLNFLSFIFTATGYFIIYKYYVTSSVIVGNNRPNNQAIRMQKRIAFLIETDFCCWISICIMAYGRLGVDFSDLVYQVSAVLLLPINSVMNPFILSSLPDKLSNLFRQIYQTITRRWI